MLFPHLLAAADSSIVDSDAARVMFGAVVLGGIIYGLSLLRDLRKNLTSEVRMQMLAEDSEAEASKLPQPLVVKPHVDFTPYSEHRELKLEFEKLREQRRADVHGLHKKIEEGLQDTRNGIARTTGELGKLQVSQNMQTAELHAIRDEQKSVGLRIDAMPQRIIQTLKDTKDLL